MWAPALRFHNGYFYIFYGDPDRGIYMVKARNAAGPWTAPILLKSARGWIDPCPFWDDDGNAYLVHAWANSRSGIKSILTINRMSPDGTRLLDDQGSTGINGPHQGAWVELKSGESWFVHFQDRGAYGRIVHLQPMKWVSDWPVIGVDVDGDGKGEPVTSYRLPDVGREYPVQAPQTSDEFARNKLGLQWQWQANPRHEWLSLVKRRECVSLAAMPWPGEGRSLWPEPNLLLQKLPAREFTVTTRVDASGLLSGERSGLVMMGRDYSYLAVVRTSTGLRIVRATSLDAAKGTEQENASHEIRGPSVYLRVTVSDGAVCEFSFSRDGKNFESLGEGFKAKPGIWIGAKVGLFALALSGATQHGHADYDWFRFEMKR